MTHMTSSSVAVSATTYDFRFNFNYTLTPVMRNHQQTVRKMYTIFHSFQLRDSETMLEYSSECVCFHIVLNKNFLLMPPWLKIRIDLISSITGVVVAIMLFIHNPRIFQKKKKFPLSIAGLVRRLKPMKFTNFHANYWKYLNEILIQTSVRLS